MTTVEPKPRNWAPEIEEMVTEADRYERRAIVLQLEIEELQTKAEWLRNAARALQT